MLKIAYHRCLRYNQGSVIEGSRIALTVLGIIVAGSVPAHAMDGRNTNPPKKAPLNSFVSGQQALRAGLEDLKAGNTESSLAALTYAAVNGQSLARWKLGEMYANGDGVPRDDLKAYHYFSRLVEDYDEDQPDVRALGAISSAFVSVGVYCLNGIPNSNIRPDPRRAHELFQYAATIFDDPNAQYNLAHMYLVGAGGVAKDDLSAIRWLALAAKQGHPPSQALLGHMLFLGDVVLDQRVRGLVWLELAKNAASNPKDQWIRQLYQRDFQAATDEDRKAAIALLQEAAKGTPPAIPATNNVTSFLPTSDASPTGRQQHPPK